MLVITIDLLTKMPDQPKKIDTAADALMSILRDVKEISLEEASKTLGVPLKTLENWATFLEEEHLLQIKYKFTTPYLVYGSATAQNKKEHAEEKLAATEKISESFDNLDQSIARVESGLRTGDFVSIKQGLHMLLSIIKTLKDSLPVEKDKRAVIEKKLNDVEALLQKANSYTEEGKFDLADRIYVELHDDFKELIAHLKTAYSEASEKRENGSTNDIKQLLDKTYLLLKEGKTEEAMETYEMMRAIYKRLPSEFAERKLEVGKNLVKLNKDMAITLDRQSVNLMKEGAKKISKLISDAKNSLNKNDFVKAEEIYYEIKRTFEALPPQFNRERRQLEKNILFLFDAISIKRKELITKAINSKISKIQGFIKLVGDESKAGRVDDAVKCYNEAKKVYDEVPNEFLNEKLALQGQLMPVYQELIRTYSTKSAKEETEKSESLKKLIAVMKIKIDSGEIKEAEETYEQIKEMFKILPPGFVREKIDLQKSIIEVYEYLLSKSDEYLYKTMSMKKSEIERLLTEASGYLNSKRPELAEEVYATAVNAYNELPPGFVYEKNVLRQKLLDLYRSLMLNSDMPLLKTTSEEVNSKYKEIVKLLVKSKRSMEKRDFGQLEPDYHKIRKIFNELPLGFVQENLKLKDSIIQLSEEVDLYRRMLSAENAVAEKSPELKSMVGELIALKERMAWPDSKPLLDHVEQRLPYFKSIIENSQEIRQKISVLRAAAAPAVRMPAMPALRQI